MVLPAWGMPHQQKQRHGHGPKRNKLCMAAGHAITFARLVNTLGPFFFDDALEGEIDGFAGELAGKHEEDFGFAGGPD